MRCEVSEEATLTLQRWSRAPGEQNTGPTCTWGGRWQRVLGGGHCLGGSAGPEPHDGALAGVPAQLTGLLRVDPGWLMGERVARGHAHELLILSPFETGSNAATMPV